MGEILYEKHCPPIPEVNYEEILNSRPAFESVFKSVLDSAGNCAMVPIPGKEKLAPLFVRLVQGAAELCLADVRVTRWETAVYAEFLPRRLWGLHSPGGYNGAGGCSQSVLRQRGGHAAFRALYARAFPQAASFPGMGEIGPK